MITPITADAEARLVKAGKEMVRLTGDGLTPNEALEKVATEYGFGPDYIDRVGQLYNTSCTLRQLQDTKGHLKRAIEHPLADPGAVVEKLFAAPTSEKAAGDNRVCASLYEDPMSIASEEMTKAAAVTARIPSYSYDPALLLKRAYAILNGVEQDVTRLGSRVYNLEERRSVMLSKAAAHFRQTGAEPFEEVEQRVKSAYGLLGEKTVEVLWSTLGGAQKLHKRASAEPTRPLFVPTQTPYRELTEVIKISCELEKARRQRTAAAEAVGEMRQDIRKRAAALAGQPEPNVKEAGMGSALQFKGVNELIDSLVDEGEVESAQGKAESNAVDPNHEAALRSIRAQSVFQRVMADDPVIGQYDPSDVADAYNEISTLAPKVATQPAVLRGYLRRFLESSPQASGRILDTFEAGQLADLDKKIGPAATGGKANPVL